jgi:hypothetical protein
MKHGHFSRNYAKAFFAFAALALVGACSDDSAVAPTAEAPAFVAPANFVKVGYSVTFRVNNEEGVTKKIGQHVINIPANAVCDLLTSGYGQTFWNKPCSPLRGSILVTATVLEGPDGAPYVDFQPAMRFAPNKEVTLFFHDKGGELNRQIVVKYCTNLGVCSDESLTDASLKPYRIGRNIIGRRVKHFSGYQVNFGTECQSTGNCDGMTRKSGYMVASGEDVGDLMGDDNDQARRGGHHQQ